VTEEGQRSIRVLLADDHPLILDGLEQLFRTDPRFRVVARCADGRQALEAIERESHDLAILDLRMPELDGLEVLERAGGRSPIILLTAEIEDDRVAEALRSGVRGLILKERAAELLLDCVDVVLQGERWVDPELSARATRSAEEGSSTARSRAVLSSREIEITRGVAAGLRNREIAEKLFISEGTVKSHIRTIFEKTGVDSRIQLVNWARREGMVD
jgi:two-component system, NarL family, nitrate/nitrite response regulator NarL